MARSLKGTIFLPRSEKTEDMDLDCIAVSRCKILNLILMP